MYVNPEARRKGVFRKLYNFVKERAQADPLVKCVRLYVELENEGAKAVYERLGMSKLDSYEFQEKDDIFSHWVHLQVDKYAYLPSLIIFVSNLAKKYFSLSLAFNGIKFGLDLSKNSLFAK